MNQGSENDGKFSTLLPSLSRNFQPNFFNPMKKITCSQNLRIG